MAAPLDVREKKILDPNKPSSSNTAAGQPKCTKVASFFRARRVAAGLSQAQVALELGLTSASLLDDYELGKKSIPLDEIFALTNILNIPPEEVIDLVQDMFNYQGAL